MQMSTQQVTSEPTAGPTPLPVINVTAAPTSSLASLNDNQGKSSANAGGVSWGLLLGSVAALLFVLLL
jgi:hypothetical protein